MRKTISIALLLFLAINILPLRGWQYPVKSLRITSLFGESRWDHFHNGVDFSIAQPIYPIEEGNLLFYSDEDEFGHFRGIGHHLVVEHPQGIRSYYYHLEKKSIKRDLLVNKNTPLATMGESGKSFGKHLHLTLVDPKNRKVLNPQLFLPSMSDNKKPIISSLFFTIREKQKVFKLGNRTIVNYKNNIKLYLIAGDIKPYYHNARNLTHFNAYGLRRIYFSIDNQMLKNIQFDFLRSQGMNLVLDNGQDFYQTYGLSFNYILGDFTPSNKTHRFYVEVEDWSGNIARKTYDIIFRL